MVNHQRCFPCARRRRAPMNAFIGVRRWHQEHRRRARRKREGAGGKVGRRRVLLQGRHGGAPDGQGRRAQRRHVPGKLGSMPTRPCASASSRASWWAARPWRLWWTSLRSWPRLTWSRPWCGSSPSFRGDGAGIRPAAGVEPVVAEAIFEHYLPRFADDRVPESPLGLPCRWRTRSTASWGISA